MEHPLRAVVSCWCKKVELAHQAKKRQFQDDADECMRFFNGPYNFLYGPDGRRDARRAFIAASEDADELPRPTFNMTVNKCAELVQLFGPALYHRNPVRKVTPRKLPLLPPECFGDPQDPAVVAAYARLAAEVKGQRGPDVARAAILE